MSANPQEKILVIKLSALGDFILALGAMEAIRHHHKDAHITLLTTRPFVDIAERSGYFNDIIVDPRPKFFEFQHWFYLWRHFNSGKFTRVYDLQMNDRTKIYRRLFLKKPQWSGETTPELKQLHAFKRHQEVLKNAGIDMHYPDLSWMHSDITPFNIKKPYVLFIPGSAPSRPEKRWPDMRYGALGLKLVRDGYRVVLLGTSAEQETISRIVKACPDAIDLSGRTSLFDIASLAREAAGAVGNDTGPTHLITMMGCPTVALFCTEASNPAQSAPVGKDVTVIQAEDLDDVSVGDVSGNFKPREAA